MRLNRRLYRALRHPGLVVGRGLTGEASVETCAFPVAISRCAELENAVSTLESMPCMVMHSAGIGTTPYCEGFLSPLWAHVKNLEDMIGVASSDSEIRKDD